MDYFPTVPRLAVAASFLLLLLDVCAVQASVEAAPKEANSDPPSTHYYRNDSQGHGEVLAEPMPYEAELERLGKEEWCAKTRQRSPGRTSGRSSSKRLLARPSGGTLLQLLAAASLIGTQVSVSRRPDNISTTAGGDGNIPRDEHKPPSASVPSVSDRLLLGLMVLLVISTVLAAPVERQRRLEAGTSRSKGQGSGPPVIYSMDGPIQVVTIGKDWMKGSERKSGRNPFGLYFNAKKFNVTLSRDTEGLLIDTNSDLERGLLGALQEALAITPEGVELSENGTSAWVWGLDYRKSQTDLFCVIDTVRGKKRQDVSYHFHLPSKVNATLTARSEKYPDALEDFRAVLQALIDEGSSRFDTPNANDGHMSEEWFFPHPVLTSEELRVLHIHRKLWEEQQPPLRRYKDTDDTEDYVIGRGWKYDKERLVKEIRDSLYLYTYKDGQAAITFTFGGTTRFSVFLSRDLETSLREKGMLDAFVKALSVSPTLPKFTQHADRRKDWLFEPREKVMQWGNDTGPQDDYQVWHEGDHNYRFHIPKQLLDSLEYGSVPSHDLYHIVVKVLLSVERARLKSKEA